MMPEIVARKLYVDGIVQGVGFRPHIHQLARSHQLKGEIANTSCGVSIHVEGSRENVDRFRRSLSVDLPPLAHITDIAEVPDTVRGLDDFSILPSIAGLARSTLISPDVSVCKDCLKELFDPADRRFRYPFINCTNCGPRYTIIADIPYDRCNTSMKHFEMCEPCRSEYDDPKNRRFHAQPNACPVCGPRVSLHGPDGTLISCNDPIERAGRYLKEGKILAVKGLGGFHLSVDARNTPAVERLRYRKHREEKPLAVMSPSLERICEFAHVAPEEKALLTSFRRPIVLLRKKEPCLLSDAVSPRNAYIGAMLPYTPLHYLLLDQGVTALVMTSGNMSEEPIAIDNADAFDRLSGMADCFLVHDRQIYLRSDDSLVRHVAGADRVIRRSRGIVPVPVFLRRPLLPVLACGAELKNTVCLTSGNRAFLSQHIGDLENSATYDFFSMTIAHMKRILDITPRVLACDLHPDYLSTRYALEHQAGMDLIQVQHHHAHIVSCMAENRLQGKLIGLAFDGTGYGTDGAIWGGEFLIADETGFERAGHLAYVPLPGGAAAIREPWRMAASHLHAVFGENMMDLDLPLMREMDVKKLAFVQDMMVKGVNCPRTSSMGRLFDAIAAMIGIRYTVAYEGQAALELEMLADDKEAGTYPFEWASDWASGDGYRILPDPIIRGVVQDFEKRVSPAVISARFHRTVIGMAAALCRAIRRDSGLSRVVLSGGVFQNALLLKGLIQELSADRFEVFSHALVPANDGGISLGQAVCAAESRSERGRGEGI
ncbi:MAG: carbamoyltransferase HypF [Deltaproteobacteria bacterium]|nr:carbamoyltransferase HypF [Deltaproteobacteria bacterium]